MTALALPLRAAVPQPRGACTASRPLSRPPVLRGVGSLVGRSIRCSSSSSSSSAEGQTAEAAARAQSSSDDASTSAPGFGPAAHDAAPVVPTPAADMTIDADTVAAEPADAPVPGAASQPPPLASHPVSDEEAEDLFGSKELIGELQDSQLFGRRGEALFLAQLSVFALLLFPPFALKGLVDLVGTLSITAGLVFMGYALASLGRNISPLPLPRKKHSLVVSGMYGYVRHPMYAGLLLTALGLAALTRSETRLALAALLWWILEQKVVAEEGALSERYPEYAEYARRVRKFIPWLY